MSLSRQNLPNLEGSTIEHASRGGYVVHDEQNEDLTIVSSGSEVCIAVEAAGKLKAEGIKTRVVSLPCWSVFDKQDQEYRLSVLRSGAPILSLEALSVCHVLTVNLFLADGISDRWLGQVQSRTIRPLWMGCIWTIPEGV